MTETEWVVVFWVNRAMWLLAALLAVTAAWGCTESPAAPTPSGAAGVVAPASSETSGAGVIIAESEVTGAPDIPAAELEPWVTDQVLVAPTLAAHWKPRPGDGRPVVLPNPWRPRPRIRILRLPRRPDPDPRAACQRVYRTHCKQGPPPDYVWTCHTSCYKQC